MSVNLKDITELEVLEELKGTETVLVNDGGMAKAIPASKFGSGGTEPDMVIRANVEKMYLASSEDDFSIVSGTRDDIWNVIKDGKTPIVHIICQSYDSDTYNISTWMAEANTYEAKVVCYNDYLYLRWLCFDYWWLAPYVFRLNLDRSTSGLANFGKASLSSNS